VSALADGVLTDYGRIDFPGMRGCGERQGFKCRLIAFIARQFVPEIGGNGRASLWTAHPQHLAHSVPMTTSLRLAVWKPSRQGHLSVPKRRDASPPRSARIQRLPPSRASTHKGRKGSPRRTAGARQSGKCGTSSCFGFTATLTMAATAGYPGILSDQNARQRVRRVL
jgi:hypothetical protein